MKIEIVEGEAQGRGYVSSQSRNVPQPYITQTIRERKKTTRDRGDERIDDKQEVASPAPPRCNYQVMQRTMLCVVLRNLRVSTLQGVIQYMNMLPTTRRRRNFPCCIQPASSSCSCCRCWWWTVPATRGVHMCFNYEMTACNSPYVFSLTVSLMYESHSFHCSGVATA